MKLIVYDSDLNRANKWAECLGQQGLSAEVQVWQDTDQIDTILADYAVVWQPTERFFQTVSGLKAVFNMGAGVDAIMKLQSLPADLPVVRLDDQEMGGKMTEYAVHAVAEITRQFSKHQQDQTSKAWNQGDYAHYQDWSIGVMGLGKIGNKIAGVLASIGYPVRGWSRSARTPNDTVTCYHGNDQLGQFLSQSRIVINVLPLTVQTQGILNADLFQQMPDNGYIINIGRGEHLDEQALLTSLNQGQLAGAVLDVFRQEPLPIDHPFWAHPAIRITPHIAGPTNLNLAMRQIANKIIAYQNGTPLSGVVDKHIGY